MTLNISFNPFQDSGNVNQAGHWCSLNLLPFIVSDNLGWFFRWKKVIVCQEWLVHHLVLLNNHLSNFIHCNPLSITRCLIIGYVFGILKNLQVKIARNAQKINFLTMRLRDTIETEKDFKNNNPEQLSSRKKTVDCWWWTHVVHLTYFLGNAHQRFFDVFREFQ